MIASSDMLIRELNRVGSDFITVRDMESGEEFVIESIGHVKEYYDSPSSHLCLNIRKTGSGNIKR